MSTIINIPHTRSPYFTGRGDEIEELRQLLNTHSTAVVCGLGGIGKTELVSQFCHNSISDFDVVFWLNAESSAILEDALFELGNKLGVIYEEPVSTTQKTGPLFAYKSNVEITQQAEYRTVGNFRTTIDWLNTNDRWLVVFDNAMSCEDIKPYLPCVPSGKLIITSRNTSWGKYPAMQLGELSQEFSQELLEKITGLDRGPESNSLVKELGYLPLAIEQAGAYILVNHICYDRYLKLFKESRIRLLEQGFGYTNNEETISTTWEISLEQIRREDKKAYELLCHCSFLEPVLEGDLETIPLKLFLFSGTVASSLDDRNGVNIQDEVELRSLIHSLSKYSICKTSPDAFSIHRLVQMVTRDRLTKDDVKAHLLRLQLIVEFSFNNNPTKKNDSNASYFYRVALSIVNSSLVYNVTSLSLFVLQRRLMEYSLDALNDTAAARKNLDEQKWILESKSRMPRLTHVDYYIEEIQYHFAVKNDELGLEFAEKARQTAKDILIDTDKKNQSLELYSKNIKYICSILGNSGFFNVAMSYYQEMMEIFLLAGDEAILLQILEDSRYYYYRALDANKTKVSKDQKVAILMMILLIEKKLFPCFKYDRSCHLIAPLEMILKLLDESAPNFDELTNELKTLKKKWKKGSADAS